MADINLEAEIVYDSYLPDALERALDYAGDDGFVASLPQLLCARTNASFDNIIWNTWFTSNSEENVLTTLEGQRVVVMVHGGGIFATPERFRKLFHANVSRFCDVAFTGLFAGKILEAEAHDLLDGKLPDGTEIPVFGFDEFKQGITDLPLRYAVIIDFEVARLSNNGYVPFDDLTDDPMMIVRAGGVEAAAAYLDKTRDRHNTKVTGSWHPFNSINAEQPQTRVPILAGNKGGVGTEEEDGHLNGYDSEYGMGGDSSIHNTSMINIARYVAVALRNESMNVRYLSF